MIDERWCNFDELIITVPVDGFVFPKECLLCGDSHTCSTKIVFKCTLSLGIAMRSLETETFTLVVPLCLKHSLEYDVRTQRRSVIAYSAIIAGLIVLCIGLAFLDKHEASEWGVVAIFGAMSAVFGSWWLLKRADDFPVKMHTREREPYQYTRFTFTFHDVSSMQRFVDANNKKDNGGAPT